jgi:alpha-galactosidase
MRTRIAAALTGVLTLAACAVGVSTAGPAAALDNGEALTPPMGWNNWNSFGCEINQQDVIDTIDLFVSTGLRDAGYEYINIDDCWAESERDPETQRLVPDQVDFSLGIDHLAGYAHENGLKLGIYSSAGDRTCQQVQPGSLGYEYIDALTFAEWGVDYLKYDNCGDHGDYTDDRPGYEARYQAMADAISKVQAETGKTLIYSICEWGIHEPWEWADEQANLWRTTFDISDTYSSMLEIFQDNVVLDDYAGPGAWNDPDMLQVGNGGMSAAEYRSHFSLWAMMAAPLLIGTDLRESSDEIMDIFLNKDVIAVNQDSRGVQAGLISDANGLYVLAKPLADGDTAVALFNSTSVNQTVSATARDVGAQKLSGTYQLTDLWSKEVASTAGTISAYLPAHETVLYRLSGGTAGPPAPPSTSLDVRSDSASVAPGGTARITVTLQNNGRAAINRVSLDLQVPAGWHVDRVASPVEAISLGKNTTATYRVTAPTTLSEPISTGTLLAKAAYSAGRTAVTKQSTFEQMVVSPVSEQYRTADTTGTGALFGQLGDELAIDAAGAGVQPAASTPFGNTPAADEYGAIFRDDALDSDGVMEVTVSSQESTSADGKAGIMVRNDMAGNGTPVGVTLYVTGAGRAVMSYTDNGGTEYTLNHPPGAGGFAGPGEAVSGTVTLRLVRSGSTYTGSWSNDGGATWDQLGDGGVTVAAAAAAALQDAGVFHTSGATGQPDEAGFTGFSVS